MKDENLSKDKLKPFINRLGHDLDLTGEEIADIIWLELKKREFSQTIQDKELSNFQQWFKDLLSSFFTKLKNLSYIVKQNRGNNNTQTKNKPRDNSQGKNKENASANLYNPNQEQQSSTTKSLPLRIPDPSSLREPLEFAKALRPLMRKVDSGRKTMLDEIATVNRIASERICLPVLKSEPEPWLDLALVIDENKSMLIWGHTIQELKYLLQSYGIFREVRIWGLSQDQDNNITIHNKVKPQKSSGSIQELIDPTARRLILIVSDCVGQMWHDGSMLKTLADWSKRQPMAIVQMLPDWQWLRTGLRLGASVELANLIPGGTNQTLLIKELLLWKDFELEKGIKVPVLTLEPSVAHTWGKMLVGKGDTVMSGVVFPPKIKINSEYLPQQRVSNLDAKQRVARFSMTSSPMGCKLAGLMAATPVITLPVVRLIQETMLPQCQPVHVAEVFLDGLLKPLTEITPDTNPDQVEFDFMMDEIGQILLAEAPITDSEDVFDIVSAYIEKQLGKSLEECVALLKSSSNENEFTEMKAFAKVSLKKLEQLGGGYKKYAQDLKENFGGGIQEDNVSPNILSQIKEFKDKQLNQLDLSSHSTGYRLEEIPAEIFELESLQKLDLRYNDIKRIPKEIHKLKNLKYLDLIGNTELTEIPQEIAELPNLTFLGLTLDINNSYPDWLRRIPQLGLDLSKKKITDLPKSITNLTNLTQLDLSSNGLETLPESIAKLSNLTTLYLSSNGLETLPESIAKLSNLTTLYLSSNGLETLPESIVNLANLTQLDLNSNQLTDIPESIAYLTNLIQLDLSSNQLTDISESIAYLTNLIQLDLSSNQLTDIPESIAYLTNLTQLDLSSNGLETLPESIANLTNLTQLDLSSNQLTDIPESITNLTNLTQLDLSSNQLTDIPESITNLTNLNQLDLSSNQLTGLPESITNLTNLAELYCEENPLETPPVEIAVMGMKAIREYFIQLKAEEEDYLYEAKIIIVGEGGAGKTSLAKKIEDLNYPVPNIEKSTEGIDIVEWHFATETGQDFRTNIWDFGGQEIYNTTHSFFLTKRSLYILVADERKENTQFDYWLNIIELLSDNSPVFIVSNERDDRKREININQLKRRFDNIKGYFSTNLATNRGLADLLKAIKFHITSLTHIGSALPKTWTTVRETLEKDSRNYISLIEYLDICEQNGFKKLEDKLQLSQFLHDIGVILHFQDDKRSLLYKTVILKPEWGTDAVYKVLDSKTVVNNFGTFTNTDLDEIWKEEKYMNMQGELLELMMKFQLCYQLPETDNIYIAPQLLKDEQPNYEWDETNNLILRYIYDFMPRGILTQFIVIMHRYIEQQLYVWKSGVILNTGESRAEIIESYNRREIKIRLSGTNQREFLANITWELDRIHESYNRLQVQKLIPCNCNVCKDSQTPHFYELNQLKKRIANRKWTIECGRPPYNTVRVQELIDDIVTRKDPVPTENTRNKIFIGYSHRDSDWLKRLQVYLKPLEKKGLVNLWDDTRIKAGMKWREEIQKALDSAKIVILLVSSNFLTSDFIDDVELPQLLKAAESEGALILPVILNPCKGIFDLSDLQQFQTVNPPSQPLSSMDTNGQDEIFNKLIERIVEISSTDS